VRKAELNTRITRRRSEYSEKLLHAFPIRSRLQFQFPHRKTLARPWLRSRPTETAAIGTPTNAPGIPSTRAPPWGKSLMVRRAGQRRLPSFHRFDCGSTLSSQVRPKGNKSTFFPFH